MSKELRLVTETWAKALRPDPLMSLVDWSDAKRKLPPASSPEPGDWRTSRTPYLAEIMEALSPTSPVEEVVLQKGTQLGGTEVAYNLLGYCVDYAPCPIMLVMPTVETAKRISKQRLDPMIELMPSLCSKIADRRSRDSGNTILQKDFPGGTLIITGSNSAVGLRSMPAKILVFDEVDGFPVDVDGEGSPVKLAERRCSNFMNSKRYKVSSPTIKGRSAIEASRLDPRATQETYHVPCPHCSCMQPITWAQIRWDKKKLPDGKVLVLKAWFECAECREAIEEKHKTWMLANGTWEASNPNADGSRRSFHISGLYSPLGWLSWKECVEEWFDAQGDPKKLKVFVNTILGETWEEDEGEGIEIDGIAGVGEDYDGVHRHLPTGALVITMFVDVQKDRLEGEVMGWGEGEESWGMDYFISMGDPNVVDGADSPWNAVRERLERKWSNGKFGPLQVACTGVDAGAFTAAVYDFVRPLLARRVYATKGSSTPGQPLIKRGRARTGAVTLVMVGTEGAKDLVVSRLKIEDAGPGFCHFPSNYPVEYFEQLTSEHAVQSYHRGHSVRKWKLKPGRKRNEALDLRVGNLVALRLLGDIDWASVKQHASKLYKKSNTKRKRNASKRDSFISGWKRGNGF